MRCGFFANSMMDFYAKAHSDAHDTKQPLIWHRYQRRDAFFGRPAAEKKSKA
jgi:hypothetical protein